MPDQTSQSTPGNGQNKPLYGPGDWRREIDDYDTPAANSWRAAWARDYGRIIHSASFRRLQGKTQVFPGHESDFFRNRLTHSLEVSQIAQAIAERLNHEVRELRENPINVQLCALAALVHDIGHPPFGHNGERALDEMMLDHGGFEGNAQSLRILACLEKKFLREPAAGIDRRAGLNLTYRTLASVIKYDRPIPAKRDRATYRKPTKGYYEEERRLIEAIKCAVVGDSDISDAFKTIECSIMDLADDIAYSTYDLEDCLKAGFLSPAGILASEDRLLVRVAAKVSDALDRQVESIDIIGTFSEIFDLTSDDVVSEEEGLVAFVKAYKASRNVVESGYFRTKLTSQLVNEFVNSIELDYNFDFPMLSKARLAEPARTKVEVLKQYTFEATIYSARVKLAEYRGYDVVKGIFSALSGEKGDLLMPDDVREFYADAEPEARPRIVCDFVAGMTDRYALEFFGRLNSDGGQSMFKPI